MRRHVGIVAKFQLKSARSYFGGSLAGILEENNTVRHSLFNDQLLVGRKVGILDFVFQYPSPVTKHENVSALLGGIGVHLQQ